MDIRSFFKKKGGGTSTSKPKAPAKETNAKNAEESNETATATAASRDAVPTTSNSTSSSTSYSGRKRIRREADSSNVISQSQSLPRASSLASNSMTAAKKKAKIKVDDDSDATTDGESAKRDNGSETGMKDEAPSIPVAKKKKKRIVVDLDDSTTDDGGNDDDEMEVDDEVDKSSHNGNGKRRQVRTPPSKKKLTPENDDNDDDEDDDDEDFQDTPADANSETDDFDDEDDDEIIHRKPKRTTRNSPSKRAQKTSSNTTTTTTKRKAPASPSPSTSTSTPKKSKPTTTTTSKPKPKPKPKSKSKPKRTPPKIPSEPISSYPYETATPECLANITFVITGILPPLSRDEVQDYIKTLGGRVTTAVSSKTTYLLCGTELEDGRDVEEGSKYRKACDLGSDVVGILRGGIGMLYAVTKMMDEELKGTATVGENDNEDEVVKVEESKASLSSATSPVSNPYAKKSAASVVSNPYAKKPSNPYARKSNSIPVNSYGDRKPSPMKSAASPGGSGGGRADLDDPNALWTDKYAPSSTRDILGNQESVKKLSAWLIRWEDTFNNPRGPKRSIGSPSGPFKAALLSGPPGIGKTTTAVLVAEEAGRQVLELNASDTRSKKSLEQNMGDVTGSQVLCFTKKSSSNSKRGTPKQQQPKRCIIMDEVDGMGAGDRSGMSELIKMIKESKVPIICICNDRQNQKMKSLIPYCLDLRYRRPVKSVIARRAVEVGQMEGMRVEMNAAEAIAESCGNDIRQVLNCLQMWGNKKYHDGSCNDGDRVGLSYRDLKERQGFINKDEILRVSMFDATRLIVEGRRGLRTGNGETVDLKAERDSLFKRSDAFFTDYSLMGLNVHQNYIKVMVAQFQETKRNGDFDAEYGCLERMHQATESMSEFALAEEAVRGGDQNWGLLPLCSILAVKTGHHVGGENGGFLPGYPEFAGWLGKNSSRGRKFRLLQELGHHMNYKVSADMAELRLGYLPALRQHFVELLMGKDGPKVTEVIEIMDDYGLDRDDLFENIDEFTLDSKAKRFSNLDSKVKASFTREYNKGIHKSQALVDEQGVTKTRKKASDTPLKEGKDPDAVDEDDDLVEDDEKEDEMDAEAVQKLFKKSGGKKAAQKKGKSPTSKGKGKKKR